MQIGSGAHEASRIAAAADLARRMAARLDGVFIGPSASELSLEQASGARATFERAADSSHVKTQWSVLEPDVGAWIARASKADLIIAPGEAPDSLEGGAPYPVLEPGCLAQVSHRPVLVLAGAKTYRPIGRCVLVAWDESPEAWRALHAAMPLLKAAETVWVMSVGDRMRSPSAADRALEDHLCAQGVVPMMVWRCAQSAARAIIVEAGQCGADLIVMNTGAWRQVSEMTRNASGRTRAFRANWPTLIAH
ncbi:MAG: universal stress protein [Caulobacteraceae bacterium]|nr:universal stress protein [Caulobacteraceae bacterium]